MKHKKKPKNTERSESIKHTFSLSGGKKFEWVGTSIEALEERDRLNQFQTGMFR